MPWIADALTEESVKVEQARRAERVDVVRVVESIEHFDDRDERVSLAKLEGSLDAPVKRKVLVVFAQGVAVRRRARGRSYRLCAAGLDTEVPFDTPGQLRKRVEVELMPDVAVRQRIVEAQIVDIKRSIREWIALV